jgi:chromosome partitioning protein
VGPDDPGGAEILGVTTIAVTNEKGGVGKTTTAVNLGSALAAAGRRTLVVDMDPQINATSHLGFPPSLSPSIHDVLLRDAPISSAVVTTPYHGLALLPSSSAMASAEVELAPQMAREFRLRTSLSQVDSFDRVLVDCPPSLGLLTVNALVAADHVIIPVQCEYLALEGLAQLMNTIDAVRSRLNPRLSVLAILLTMEDKRNRLSQQVAEEVVRHFSSLVAQTRIPRAVRLAEAPSHGQPIDVYDPGSRAAEAYVQFAREIESRLASPLTAPAMAS